MSKQDKSKVAGPRTANHMTRQSEDANEVHGISQNRNAIRYRPFVHPHYLFAKLINCEKTVEM